MRIGYFNRSFAMWLVCNAADEGGSGGAAAPDAAAAAAAAPDAAAAAAAAAADANYEWLGFKPTADDQKYLEAKNFKSPEALYKSLRGAEKMLGGGVIPAPPDNPDKVLEWYKESGLAEKLGVPVEAKDYGVEMPVFDDTVKEFIQYDDQRHERFLNKAHELNLTPTQLAGIRDFYATEMTGDVKAFADAAVADQTESTTALKREWGADYEVNQRAALEVAAELGVTPEAVESLRVGKVAGSTLMTKMLHELAVARGNATLKGGAGPGTAQMTKEAAAEALAAFTAKNGKALNTREDPQHEWAMAELTRLKALAGRGSAAAT